MSRSYRMTSLFLGQLGVALLLLSIILVPQSRSLAGGGQKTCNGDNDCITISCTNYYTLNSKCPDVCSDDSATYCFCATKPNDCGGCICTKNPVQPACSCRVKQ